MAVQAQYSSYPLFLTRGAQDGGKNPVMNTGAGGGIYLDQTEMLVNYGVVDANTRKRGREHSLAAVIDLTELPSSPPPPPNVVSTGLRLAFGEQQQLQHRQHSICAPSSHSPVFYSALAEDLGNVIKQQRDEIELYLRAQGEQLRRTLEEKRQRYYRALLGAAEESAVRRLKEKDADVEKARRRNIELEARAAKLSAEAQAWQARAREQEITAVALQAQLQHALVNGGGGGRAGCGSHLPERNDGSGQGCAGGDAEDAESAYIDPDRVEASAGTSCRTCRKRVAAVVLLPCRHLCLCVQCDAVCMTCPLCQCVKSSSVEVFLC
ncbi:unnamed protein product [Cuscuta europaea]|uniref:RING-type domain-containing protein n=1 Tax=Cuscuta europaea TaxID=41803 RepID=A0A9P1E8G2_CUSEU|nr:unnamed protein product [Cuscuta europaea]